MFNVRPLSSQVTQTVPKPSIHRWWLNSHYHKVGT
jgi:hypothetical protein